MKKLMQKLVCFTMILALMPTLTVRAASPEAKEIKFTNACDMAGYIYAGYYHCSTAVNPDFNGPIHIVKAELHNNNRTTPVYLVGISGTELIFNQPTNIITDLRCGFEKDNVYLREIVNVICDNVPIGSNLIITGHSLGGMEAQQVSGNLRLKLRYNIMNVISFGSPLITPDEREGTLRRLGDKADIVPYMSINSINRPVQQILGLEQEDGGYGDDFAAAHMKSYLREDVWGDYDVLGFKGGNATITFSEQVKGYGAYIIPFFKDLPVIDLSPWS
ncbi:hypothetical protein C805_02846 [Eubacterium sp. 14-2]|uniref:hypothetical protein n=1 Tax=Eubacterium sp. 14-2 TaxID=1235790 RepID=UPI0003402621|nr:hypothetical protein [Eubacterium sp. 14-2]EOT24634.1 hypothetical protein C805_02846 [Eubacterium sp. 14-2]